MRDSASVITQAVKGVDIHDLAFAMDVTPSRMYEILSTSCPYPRMKILIRAIGKFSAKGARLIRADLDTMFEDILGETMPETNEVELHREAFEAVQACLEHRSRADRIKELRELLVVTQTMLNEIEHEDAPTLRQFARDAVNSRRAR